MMSHNYRKVSAFCDINPKKVGTTYHCRETKRNVPIVHFTQPQAPLICCVAMGRTDGELEANIAKMNLLEGENFWHFI